MLNSVTREIPLRSNIPVDFEFSVRLLQSSPSFSVSPTSGVVPGNSETKIKVTFLPKRFATESVQIQLIVSQYDNPKLICLVTGSCSSKIVSLDIKPQHLFKTKKVNIDLANASPLDRARLRQSKNDELLNEATTDWDDVDVDKLNVELLENVNMWKSQTIVNRLLIEDPNKPRVRDIQNGNDVILCSFILNV